MTVIEYPDVLAPTAELPALPSHRPAGADTVEFPAPRPRQPRRRRLPEGWPAGVLVCDRPSPRRDLTTWQLSRTAGLHVAGVATTVGEAVVRATEQQPAAVLVFASPRDERLLLQFAVTAPRTMVVQVGDHGPEPLRVFARFPGTEIERIGPWTAALLIRFRTALDGRSVTAVEGPLASAAAGSGRGRPTGRPACDDHRRTRA